MSTTRRLHGALALGLTAGVLLAPALAGPSVAAQAAPSCEVTGATLSWGFKESFRSYISGTIANGAWETTGGAAYETPRFSWTIAGGSLSPDDGTGEIAFSGAVRFTGHGGLLDTTVADPVLSLTGPGVGRLSLDVTGTTMEQAMSGGEVQPETRGAVPLVELDLSAAALSRDGDTVTYTADAAPAAITAEGYDAFGNYPAGTAFDPVSVVVTADCPPVAVETAASPTTAVGAEALDAAAASSATPAPAWLPWTVGGAIALTAAGAGAAVVVRRRRTS